MKEIIEKVFKLSENSTTTGREIRAGVVTFATMAYIIIVNPAILNEAGMDFRSVMTATCISAAVATLIMAFLANYPIALAPGMGLNAFFAYTICGSLGIPWQSALAMVFVSGCVFLLLSISGAGDKIFTSIPHSIRIGTSAGIGLFIAFIGLQKAGIVVSHPVTFVTSGNMLKPYTILSLSGLFFTAILFSMEVRGAILIGILSVGVISSFLGYVEVKEVVSLPTLKKTAFHLNFNFLLNPENIFIIFALLFVDVFDTLGTFLGIGEAGGFVKNGRFPRIGKALFADAAGTIAGAFLGTSTVTSYIESAAGISEGGRTGLTSLVVAVLFLLAPFFAPFAEVFGSGITVNGNNFNPVTSPALIIVGTLMLQHITKLNWSDFESAFVGFITMVSMPLTYSISDGLALGFISFFLLKLGRGKIKEIGIINFIIAIFCILKFIYGGV